MTTAMNGMSMSPNRTTTSGCLLMSLRMALPTLLQGDRQSFPSAAIFAYSVV